MAKFVIIMATLFVVSMAKVIDVEKEAAKKLENAKKECVRSINRAQREVWEEYQEKHTNENNDDLFNILDAATVLFNKKNAEARKAEKMEPVTNVFTHKNQVINCSEAIAKDVARISEDAFAAFHNYLCTDPECPDRKTAIKKCVRSLDEALQFVFNLFRKAPEGERQDELEYVWEKIKNQVNLKLKVDARKATEMGDSNGMYKTAGTVFQCSPEIARNAVTAINTAISRHNDIIRWVSEAQLESKKQKCINSLNRAAYQVFEKIMNTEGKSYYQELIEVSKPLFHQMFTYLPAEVNEATSVILSDDPQIFCSRKVVEKAREILEQTEKKIGEVMEKHKSS